MPRRNSARWAVPSRLPDRVVRSASHFNASAASVGTRHPADAVVMCTPVATGGSSVSFADLQLLPLLLGTCHLLKKSLRKQ